MQPNLLVRCPLRPSSVASRQTQLQSQNLAQHLLPQPQIGFNAHTNTARNPLFQQQGPMARQQPLAATFADMFCSQNLQSDALRRLSPQHNRPVAHTMTNMSNVQSLSIQIMHLRRAIRNVDNAIAAQQATLPSKDPMLKVRALGLLLSKKDTLLRLLNGAITAMCVSVLPILRKLIVKPGTLNLIRDQSNNNTCRNNRSSTNNPLLSHRSTPCWWSEMHSESASHPWRRFIIHSRTQFWHHAVSSPTPDRFR
jgi:hypothetical protein